MPTRDEARAEVRAQLTGEGGYFELEWAEVLGERVQVLKNRVPSLRALLAASAERGDVEYLVEDDRRISYAEHVKQVASVAAGLRERYGIEPGDRIAVLSANRIEWPLSFWASASLGAITASLNGWWTADEIRYGIRDCDPKLVIADSKRLDRVRGEDLGAPVLEIEKEFGSLLEHAPGAELPDQPIDEDAPAVILYTSGTTGRPKGAIGSHRGILGLLSSTQVAGAEMMVTEAKLGGPPPAPPAGQPITLVTSPMFHLSGLYATIVLQLSLGGKLVIYNGRFDAERVLGMIEKERVTAWGALGSMGPRVAKHPKLESYDRSSVTSVGFGGAPVSPATQDLMRGAFPNARQSLGIGYGSSETVSVPVTIRGKEYDEVPESTGRVVPGHEVEIRDEHDRVLPEGEEGEIHVRSPYVMLGYWRNDEATRKAIKPGRWLATGDIGRFENGLLYINSRARDMILRNAENIYPVEIEYRLEKHPEVREAAVIGVDHEEWGQEVKAIVVPEGDASPDPEALARFCGETLAAYKVPTAWEFRREPLPRNPSGKVLKNVLEGGAEARFVDGEE